MRTLAKCIGICATLPTKHTNCQPWIGVSAYWCSACEKRIGINDAKKDEHGKVVCPCCGQQLRTRGKSKGKWERFAA